MSTYLLNLDILTELIVHLPPRDALVYGSTCHFLRTLSIRHAVSNVQFSSASRLTQFCHFVVTDPSSRAPFIRSLSLLPSISKTSAKFLSSLAAVADLLTLTTNLSSLTLSGADLILMCEPTLFTAITAVPRLTSLSLNSVGNDAQDMLLQLRCAPHLERLHISEEWTISQHDPLDPSHDGIRLPPLPRLQTLILTGVKSKPLHGLLPSLAPSLRTLHLSRVEFTGQAGTGSDLTRCPPNSFNLLRSDALSLARMGFLQPVRAIELDATRIDQLDGDGFAALGEALACASPQRLAVRMQASGGEAFRKLSVPVLSRLRYLEVIAPDAQVLPLALKLLVRVRVHHQP